MYYHLFFHYRLYLNITVYVLDLSKIDDHIPKSILLTYKTKNFYELADSLNEMETRYMN